MNKILTILIFFIITLSINTQENKWEFKIELDKENYLLEENIWFDVTITNISTDTLVSACYIPSRGIGFQFIVTDSFGNNIDYTGYYQGASYTPKSYLVMPGEQLYRCFNLKYLYKDLSQTAGSYTIQGSIDLPFENACYFDNLTSSELSFKVVEPSSIEKEAYKLNREADSLQKNYQDNTEQQRLDVLQKLLDIFPNSVYAEESFRKIKREYLKGLNYKKSEGLDYVEIGNKILFQYPNSGDSENRLGWIFELNRRSNEAKQLVGKEKLRLLNGIIRVAPDTRLAKFAKQILQRDRRIQVIETCESIVDTIPRWDLKIELPKNNYSFFEDIWVDVTITNITSDTLKSDCDIDPYKYDFTFTVFDSLGNRLESTPDMTVCYGGSPPKTFLVEPGGEIYTCINLKSFYAGVLNQCESRYIVQAYFTDKNFYNPYEFNNLLSNKLVFDVGKLSADEKKAQKLSRNAWKLQYTKDTSNLDTQAHQELLNKYPNSIFAELSYRCLNRYTKEMRKMKENGTYDNEDYTIKLMENYPNFGEFKGHLISLIKDLEVETKLEKLNQIIIDYPNTRAAKFAKQILLRDSREQVPK